MQKRLHSVGGARGPAGMPWGCHLPPCFVCFLGHLLSEEGPPASQEGWPRSGCCHSSAGSPRGHVGVTRGQLP